MDLPGLKAAELVVSWGGRVSPGYVNAAGAKVALGLGWGKTATQDPERLAGLWAQWPYAWVGVVGGPGSWIVLDADGSEGVSTLRTLVSSLGGMEAGGLRGGWLYRTPGKGGGLHWCWRWPDWLDGDFRIARAGGVEIRGTGHFTLLCGARRRDGKYEILEEPGVGSGGPLQAPRNLIDGLLAQADSVVCGRGGGGDLRELSLEDAWAEGRVPWEDGRKNAVAGLAWYLAIRGECAERVVEECVRFGAGACRPALDEETCRVKAEYAVSRAERHRAELEQAVKRSFRFVDF